MTKKLKTIKIKGKDYVLVSTRVAEFNEIYKNGAIRTEILSNLSEKVIVVKATVTPDLGTPERYFTGHAQETVGDGYINETSALENAETSAVGRALGLMGIGSIDSIASADEIIKSENMRSRSSYDKAEGSPTAKVDVIANDTFEYLGDTYKLYFLPSKYEQGKNYMSIVNTSTGERINGKPAEELYNQYVETQKTLDGKSDLPF